VEKVLITGGTGLIGSRLIPILQEKGYEVVLLSRTEQTYMGCKAYEWDISKGEIDERAFEGISSIIHLAGAGIADKRWTDSRKRVLIDSRVKSAQLLRKYVLSQNLELKSFISASGIGYYGTETTDHVYTEADPPADEFVSEICIKWEAAADDFKELCRVVKLRTGVVLSKEGGALVRLAQPIKLGVGAAIGSGDQYMPCIHIDDLCRMYLHCLKDQNLKGVYNAVSGERSTNKELTKAVARQLNKPLWLPNVPGFIMKLVFGEMAQILLGGSHVSAEKIKSTGFEFQFPTLKEALEEIY
jgi:uncharacterized protein (TIGR01777 family)